MLGRDEDTCDVLERAYQRTSTPASRSRPRAARSGSASPCCCAARWAARADGSAARSGSSKRTGGECVERGYLLIPLMFRHEAAGDLEAAAAVAADAAAIGERFGDRDLFALAAHAQGHFLVKQGRSAEGLALLDEAMLAVTRGRAVADRQRHRLLRRDPRLPGGLRTCVAPRSGRRR